MKLNEQQIRFIDAYLKDSGVDYLDIRCEMTDHVAAAIEEMEGDFRDNFKQYMLEHKKSLLASNRKFRRIAVRKAAFLLLGNLIRLRFLAIATTIFFATYFMVQVASIETVAENFFIGFIFFIFVLLIYYWYLRLSGRSKFSVVNNLLGISSMTVYFAIIPFRIERWTENQILILAYYGFFSAFIIEVLFTFRQLRKKYKLQYGR